eukprot:scaffold912_cov187-Ochromonas_danica.AAC.45
MQDIESYFHLSGGRVNTLLVNLPAPDSSVGPILPLATVWNLTSRASLASSSHHLPTSNKGSEEVGSVVPVHRRSRGNSIILQTLAASPEDMISQFLSTMDEGKMKQHHQSSFTMMSPFDEAQGGAAYKQLFNGMDKNKIFLLQQAFASLNNFFSLYQSITSGGANALGGAINNNSNNRFSQMSGRVMELEDDNMQGPPTQSDLLIEDMKVKLKEYQSLLGASSTSATTDSPPTNMTIANTADPPDTVLNNDRQSLVNVPSDGLQYLLAEDLFNSQTTLSQLQKKIHILETIQADHLHHIQSLRNGSVTSSSNHGYKREKRSATAYGHSSGNHRRDGNNNGGGGLGDLLLDSQQREGRDSPAPSFEEILRELSDLGTELSERTHPSFPLGLLLENPDAHLHPSKAIFSTLYQIDQMSYEMEKMIVDIHHKDEVIKELVHQQESSSFEKSDLMTVHLEYQILREKMNKYSKDENLHKAIETRNIELTKRVKELEEQIHSLSVGSASNGNNNNNNNNLPSSSSAPGGGSSQSTIDVTTLLVDASNVNAFIHNANIADNDKVRKLSEYITSLHMQYNNLSKENNKLTTNIQYLEKRIKNAINDQMTLHNQIYALEDEITLHKATITKLTRDLEEHKVFKYYKEEYDKNLVNFQIEISKYKNELNEASNNQLLADKYHNDLINAERTIEGLEHKISEYNIELEKGQIAQSQLESLREQLKAKSKEMRDMSLHVHGLETQLKEVPYLHKRYQEVVTEFQDCKNKVEKIPGLLAEIARLRGSARASIKALSEQDKMLQVYKNRVKALEKETVLLKHDNRALQDVENKLKEANNEVKRLLTLLAEANNPNKASSATSSNMTSSTLAAPSQEEKRDGMSPMASSGMNKKMQKYMRQTAFFSTNTSTSSLSPPPAPISSPGQSNNNLSNSGSSSSSNGNRGSVLMQVMSYDSVGGI